MRSKSMMLAVVLAAYLTQGCGATGNNNPVVYPELSGYLPVPGSGIPNKPRDESASFRYVVYVPFVKNVKLPSLVYEGEPFDVILEVSANYRPAILNGVDNLRNATLNVVPGWALDPHLLLEDQASEAVAVPADITGGAFLMTSIKNPLGLGQPSASLVYRIEGLPAGKVRIAYYSTSQEERGGIGWFVMAHEVGLPLPGDPVEWIDKYVEKREIFIEVLPRQEVGGGRS